MSWTDVTVNKSALISQMGLALSDISSLDNDCLLVNVPKIQLNNRLEFSSLSTKSRKSNRAHQEIQYLAPDQVIALVKNHITSPCMITNRLLYMLFTGCRIENSIFSASGKVRSHEFIESVHSIKKVHSEFEACQIPSSDCYHCVVQESKTHQKERFYLHPKIYSIYLELNRTTSTLAINTQTQHVNKYIVQRINPSFTSHVIRKTLANLVLAPSRNTGAWRSSTTMKRHYVNMTTRISDLMQFVCDQTSF